MGRCVEGPAKEQAERPFSVDPGPRRIRIRANAHGPMGGKRAAPFKAAGDPAVTTKPATTADDFRYLA
jgi:hypothetical protein